MKLYVEGGGDAAALKTACREGFAKFLGKAGLAGCMPRVVACGSRADAYYSFCTALRSGEAAMLLVDSEAPVLAAAQLGDAAKLEDRERWQPWMHLKHRQGDGWDKPTGSEELECHLMVQCMEAWFLADRGALQEFFGQGFKESALPAPSNRVEDVGKQQIYDALAKSTRSCKTKSAYGKGEHSFKLLALVDPAQVEEASPWAKRFLETLRAKMALK